MKELSINSNYLKYHVIHKYKKNTLVENYKELSLDIKIKTGKKLHWRTIYNNIHGITFRMSTIRAIAETLELDNNKLFSEILKIGY